MAYLRWRLSLLLAAAIVFAAILPSTASADADVDFQRNQNFEKIHYKNRLDEISALDANHPSLPMTDVLSLFASNGQLALHTNLPDIPMGQSRKLKIGSDTDWSIVNVSEGAAGSDPLIPNVFVLNRTQFDQQHTDTLSVQEMKAIYLIIRRRTESASGLKVVQLQMLSSDRSQKRPGSCQLTIADAPPKQSGAPAVWHSADFTSFMREHPVEADRYVRPLLHQVGQEAAMAPDPMLAFEVFSDRWTPDAATTAKITGLVADLAAGDFHARTRAERDLANLGKAAAVVLMNLDRTQLTAEQTARVDKLLSPYQPVPAKDAAALRADSAFLLDCLYSDDPIIRKAALTNLKSASKLTLNFDPGADEATRDGAFPALLKQLIDAKVIVEKP